MKLSARILSALTAAAMSLSPLALTLLPVLPQAVSAEHNSMILTAHAGNQNYENLFSYVIEEDHVCVTDFLAEEVDIPDMIEGLPVTKIMNNEWFYDSDGVYHHKTPTVKVRRISFPSTLKTISGELLNDCPELKELVLPASLESFGVVKDDPALESITVEAENSHYQSIDGVLYNADGKYLVCYPPGKRDEAFTIPEGVYEVYFQNNPYLKELTFPSGRFNFSAHSVEGCTGLEAFHVPAENLDYQDQDGVLLEKNGTVLCCYPPSRPDTSYTVGDQVKQIMFSAFEGQQTLKEIVLPSKLTQISGGAFRNAPYLEIICFAGGILPDGLDVAAHVFEGTPYYEKLVPEDGLLITPDGILLQADTEETELYIPASVKTIAAHVFGYDYSTQVYGNTAVKSIIVASPCTFSGHAFTHYTGTLTLKAPVTVCTYGFTGCDFTELVFQDDCILHPDAFNGCGKLTRLEFDKDVTTLWHRFFAAIWNASALQEIVIHGNAFLNGSLVRECNPNLQVTVEQNCTLWSSPFKDVEYTNFDRSQFSSKLRVLGEITVLGAVPDFFEDVECTRQPLHYTIADPACKLLTAQSQTTKLPGISVSTEYTGYYSFSGNTNGGYWGVDKLQELCHPDGTRYAVTWYNNESGNVAAIIPENNDAPILELQHEGFRFGAAGFDDQGRLYILWGKPISKESVDADPEQENLVLIRYDMQGNETGRRGIPVKKLGTRCPFDAGNAHVCCKNGQVLCLFTTEWGYPGEHSFNGHQGMEYIAVNAETMELTNYSNWEASHSFGSSVTETEYGFAAIQMGDGYPRGVEVLTYWMESDSVETISRFLAFHSTGETGVNNTYTHLGGIAHSHSTYAIVGKSARHYASRSWSYNSEDPDPSKNVDVFVRMVDQSLSDGAEDLAGEERTDIVNGEVVDRNIIWLTDTAANPNEKYGETKIVTLPDGSYCVLWERFLTSETNARGEFDSVRMVILDECGNVLQGETEIQGARLSTTSTMPIVQGNTLHWATASTTYDYTKEPTASICDLTWYSLTLGTDAPEDMLLGDVNLDGTVNATDAAQVLIAAAAIGAGQDSGLTEAQKNAADVNHDSSINASDAAVVLIYAAAIGAGQNVKLTDFVH